MAFVQAMDDSKKNVLPQGLALTENGALSHSTTQDGRLDYFAKVLRDTPEQEIRRHLNASWKASPLDTMRLIAQKRDCRGGSGEKKAFYESIRWTVENHPEAASAFIPLVPHFGTWKDGFLCFCDTSLEKQWLQFVANQLKEDLKALDAVDGKDSKTSVSLCAKWVPSERSSLNKRLNGVYDRLVEAMEFEGGVSNQTRKHFRTAYLTPIRQYINIVERMMCGKQWEHIDYQKVPSVAMNRLRKAFKRNDPERFQSFLDDVSSGKKTIKASQLFPHEMVRHYYKNRAFDQVIDEQWKAYVEKTSELGQLDKAVIVSDVSGSMECNDGLPMMVSIALGLLISTLTNGPFNGTVITFETSPKFHKIDTKQSLKDQVRQLRSAPWGGSTNVQAVFDLILDRAKQHNLNEEDMPRTLIIVSDMQFNSADRGISGGFFTNFEHIKAKYRHAGYNMPQLIFWNVAGRTEDFPVTKSEFNTAMVSGFSPCHLKYLTTGKITTPYDLMREAIDSERYACVGKGLSP